MEISCSNGSFGRVGTWVRHAASQSALLVQLELVSVEPGRCEGSNLMYNCHADCRKPGRATLGSVQLISTRTPYLDLDLGRVVATMSG